MLLFDFFVRSGFIPLWDDVDYDLYGFAHGYSIGDSKMEDVLVQESRSRHPVENAFFRVKSRTDG